MLAAREEDPVGAPEARPSRAPKDLAAPSILRATLAETKQQAWAAARERIRQLIDPDDIYFVEAIADDTQVRTRAARALRDVRPIGEIARVLLSQGFVRAHRNYLVNPAHVREVRRRPGGEDWELRLEPPVNVVLPVSRSSLRALWAAFGEAGGSRRGA